METFSYILPVGYGFGVVCALLLGLSFLSSTVEDWNYSADKKYMARKVLTTLVVLPFIVMFWPIVLLCLAGWYIFLLVRDAL